MKRKAVVLLLTTVMVLSSSMVSMADGGYTGWKEIDGKSYWYENDVRQGYNPEDSSYRGKEIYDPGTRAWYWLDNVQQGAKATSKDVYQESQADAEGTIGKWVRYDADGHMVKGWDTKDGNKYYFDPTYGTMAKGIKVIDGVTYEFDEVTGILKTNTSPEPVLNGWKTIDGKDYWYENGVRQGYDPNNPAYRGKEIYDPGTNAWYWLDNVQQGAKATSKDVYQESQSDYKGTIGKWVRYDAEGHMVKGWSEVNGVKSYFNPTYGSITYGKAMIDGKMYTFDSVTGALTAESEPKYNVVTDPDGHVYDLKGMDIIIRDWWSSGVTPTPTNDYERAQKDYRDFIQDTYNFTIKELEISDWNDVSDDFILYTVGGGDDHNYVFTLRDAPGVTSAAQNGLMYDLSTLDCLDFTKAKFTMNKVHEQYTIGSKITAMYAGASEPRVGIFFNKRLLREAGIDPESIYDLQESGQWTWAKWQEIMAKVQVDKNQDGILDVKGVTANTSTLINSCVWSNSGEFVGNTNGYYTYKLENTETVEGLNFAVDIFKTYFATFPTGANWDYYKFDFTNGNVAFLIDETYVGNSGGYLNGMRDEVGYVCFPKGPQATDYTNLWTNNLAAIPACYDADRAWNIAFAWNLYTDEVPGYENNEQWKKSYEDGKFDSRAINETISRMRQNGRITFDQMVPNLNKAPDLLWDINANADVTQLIADVRGKWKQYIADANANIK